jgi:hypothetical protein
MTAYAVNPAVVLYDVTGSLIGVPNNPIWVNTTGTVNLDRGNDFNNPLYVSGSLVVNFPAVTGTLDEQGEKSFYTIVTGSIIDNDKSMFSIFNDVGSAVDIKLYGLWIVNVQVAAVKGDISVFELRRILGHASGSSVSAVEMSTQDSLDANVTLKTGATVLGESQTLISRYQWSSDEWGTGKEEETEQHSLQTLIPLWTRVDENVKPLTLKPGQGFTVKHAVNSKNGKFDIHALFSQVYVSSSVQFPTIGAVVINQPVVVTAVNALPVTGTVTVNGVVTSHVTGTVNLDRGNDATSPLFVTGTVSIVQPIIVTTTGSLPITGAVTVNGTVTAIAAGIQVISGTVNLDRGNDATSPLYVTVSSTGSLSVTTQQPLQVTGTIGISGDVSITTTGSLPVQVQNQVTVTTTGALSVIMSAPVVVSGTQYVQGVQQTGSIVYANPIVVGGIDSSGTLRVPLVDSSGVQYVTLTSPSGTSPDIGRFSAFINPRGNLNVSLPATSLLLDKFDEQTIDLNRWNVLTMNGGVATVTSASLVLRVLTGSYSIAMLNSKFSPASQANAALHFASVVEVPAPVSGTNYFWGFGRMTYDSSKYVQDGIGFECDYSGSYNAVIYVDSVKFFVKSINSCINSGYNTYRIFIYNNEVYYYVNSLEAPCAIAHLANWKSTTMPVMLHVANDNVVLSRIATMFVNSVAVGDTGRNNTAVTDAKYPFRSLKIDEHGSQRSVLMSSEGQELVNFDGKHTLSVSDDTALQVLNRILVEMKKMNFQLSLLTNVQLSDSDIAD